MNEAMAVARKELRQVVRDRRTLAILLLVPIFFLVLFGYALSFDVRNVALAVQDRDQSTESRTLVNAFLNSGYFDLTATFHSDAELNRLMDTGNVRVALVVPEGTGRSLRRGDRAPVQVLINGDNSTTASTVLAYSTAIIRGVSTDLIVEQRGSGLTPPVLVEPRIWFNPELKSALFLVPGLIGFIGMIVAAISTAISVVREKERGTWEQVRMAPIGTVSYVVGKTLPYLGLSLVTSLAIVVASMWLFDLPMRGSWGALLAVTTAFLVCALGTGLLVSTVATSQLVAFQVVLILAFLPTFLLSGFVFPIRNMPEAIQVVTYLTPARYFLVALRGVVLKGVSLWTVWHQMAAMGLYAVIVLGLSSLRLSRERG